MWGEDKQPLSRPADSEIFAANRAIQELIKQNEVQKMENFFLKQQMDALKTQLLVAQQQIAQKDDEIKRFTFLCQLQAKRNIEVKDALIAAASLLGSVPLPAKSTATLPHAHHPVNIESIYPNIQSSVISGSVAPVIKGAEFVEVIENGRKVMVQSELAVKFERQKRLQQASTSEIGEQINEDIIHIGDSVLVRNSGEVDWQIGIVELVDVNGNLIVLTEDAVSAHQWDEWKAIPSGNKKETDVSIAKFQRVESPLVQNVDDDEPTFIVNGGEARDEALSS